MALRYVPDPESLAVALAARVDGLEQRLRDVATQLHEVSDDVTALGRGVADLAGQVRRVADAPLTLVNSRARSADGTPPPAGPRPGGAGGQSEDEEPEPQPDWFAVEDPSLAQTWIGELLPWTATVLHGHRVALTAVCWPLHPDVVAELLALRQEHVAAYAGARPTAVSEWLARWLPTARDRLDAALAGCAAERGHRHDGHVYDPTDLDPLSVATWWATDRHVPAPQAFALHRLA